MSKLIAALLGIIAVCSVYSAHVLWVGDRAGPAASALSTRLPQPDSTPAQAMAKHPEGLLQRLHSLESSLDGVKRSLRAEQASTLALQREVLELRDRLEQQTPEVPGTDAAAEPATASADAANQRAEEAHAASRWYQDLANPLEPSAVNLVAAGVDPDTASDISRRLDEYTLAELDIRDKAAREGWLQSDDFSAREEALLPPEVDLRSELGDLRWDRFLYLQGRNNRVRIESVINGSAAARAGIEAGDLLLTYAGERIFTVGELQEATRAGQRDEVVTLRLERQGTFIDTTIERGPLGVMLGTERVSPDASGQAGLP